MRGIGHQGYASSPQDQYGLGNPYASHGGKVATGIRRTPPTPEPTIDTASQIKIHYSPMEYSGFNSSTVHDR